MSTRPGWNRVVGRVEGQRLEAGWPQAGKPPATSPCQNYLSGLAAEQAWSLLLNWQLMPSSKPLRKEKPLGAPFFHPLPPEVEKLPSAWLERQETHLSKDGLCYGSCRAGTTRRLQAPALVPLFCPEGRRCYWVDSGQEDRCKLDSSL
jgi:hypothetical protein